MQLACGCGRRLWLSDHLWGKSSIYVLFIWSAGLWLYKDLLIYLDLCLITHVGSVLNLILNSIYLSGNSVSKLYCPVQRHTIRYRRSSTTACPACWAVGANEFKQCTVREKIFCTWPTRAAKVGQKSLVPARKAQPRKESFHSYSLSPHLSQFQQSAGATPL